MQITFEEVAQVISKRFKIDSNIITPDSNFEDLGLDSLSQIELAWSIEKTLGITIDDDDMAEVSIISEIIELANRVAQ